MLYNFIFTLTFENIKKHIYILLRSKKNMLRRGFEFFLEKIMYKERSVKNTIKK